MAVADRWLTDSLPSHRFPHYTRANAGEVLPNPVTPLGWTLFCQGAMIPGFRTGWVGLGVLASDEADEFIASFGGYAYINLTMARLFGVRTPGGSAEAVDEQWLGNHPDTPPYEPEPWHHSEQAEARVGERIQWVLSAEDWLELDSDRQAVRDARARRPDLAAAEPDALVAHARSLLPLAYRLCDRHNWSAFGANVAMGLVHQLCEGVGEPETAGTLLSAIGEVDSAAPSLALWELSRTVAATDELTEAFDEGVPGLYQRLRELGSQQAQSFVHAFDGFLFEYGARGPDEWEMGARTWETTPDLALALLDRMRLQDETDSPQARFEARRKERETTFERLQAVLGGTPEQAGMLQAGVRAAGLFFAGRERTKTNAVMVLHEMRLCMDELGRKAAAAGANSDPWQVYMLLGQELETFAAAPDGFAQVLADRRAAWQRLWELEPPFVIPGSSPPPLSQWPQRKPPSAEAAAPGAALSGLAGAPGQATGRARIVADVAAPEALEPGDVLVTRTTDPSWTPLFVTAGAVIVETGAAGSHAVIVSRELGVPCVSGLTDATTQIPDGALVTVDGATGTVTLVEA